MQTIDMHKLDQTRTTVPMHVATCAHAPLHESAVNSPSTLATIVRHPTAKTCNTTDQVLINDEQDDVILRQSCSLMSERRHVEEGSNLSSSR